MPASWRLPRPRRRSAVTRSVILLLACLLTWGCSPGRSPTTGLWVNPPLVEAPALDYQLDKATGLIIISTREEATIGPLHAAFTKKAWDAMSAWVSQIYEDGKVRWTVLEEANKP